MLDARNRLIAWLEKEFTAVGCDLLPCDVYETSRWEVGRFGLDVLDGLGAGPARDRNPYFPALEAETPPGGDGALVRGTAPQPSGQRDRPRGAPGRSRALPGGTPASWASALPSTLSGSPQGSILLVDLPPRIPTTAGVPAPLVTYWLTAAGETEADLAAAGLRKRLWLHPGLAMPLSQFAAMGVGGVILILDASYEALKGQYLPFEWQNEDVPALYVDRDTGAKLRGQSATRPKARLTLTAT